MAILKEKPKWVKKVIFKDEVVERYEYVKSPYSIDISIGKEQGHSGSNQVNVFDKSYGGWILGTPKNFSSRKEVNKFVREAKAKLEAGETGERVPFPA